MLPCAVILQSVEAVARRIAQVVEALRPVEHPQFGERAVLDIGWHMSAAQAVPDALGLNAGVGKTRPIWSVQESSNLSKSNKDSLLRY